MARPLLARALAGEPTERVPVAPLYLSLYLAPQRRRQLAAIYREGCGGEGELTLSAADDLRANLEALRRAWTTLPEEPDWLPGGLGPARSATEGGRVVCRGEQVLCSAPGSDRPSLDLAAPYDDSLSDTWEKADLPSPEELAQALPVIAATARLADGQADWPRLLRETWGDRLALHGGMGSPFWSCYSLFGFRGLMEAVVQRPDLLRAAMSRWVPSHLEHARACRQAGLEVMFVEECLTGSDLLSPRDYHELVWPYTRELLAGLKELGFAVVFYPCGGIEDRLEALAELPWDALALEESKKGFVIDLGRVRRELGPERLLFSNTDVVFLRDASEAQIHAEVARQWEAAGPRLVISTGSPLTLTTPPEQLGMLVRAARALG